jgi:hypothetical protein
MTNSDHPLILHHDRADRDFTFAGATFGLLERGQHHCCAKRATTLQLGDSSVVRSEAIVVKLVAWHGHQTLTIKHRTMKIEWRPDCRIQYA